MQAPASLDAAVASALPPLAPGLPIVGSGVALLRDALAAFVAGYHALGPIFRVRVPGRSYTIMAGPRANAFLLHGGERYLDNTQVYRHVARELAADQYPIATAGDRHRRLRRMLGPAFSREAIAQYVPRMVAVTEDAVRDWPVGQRVRVPRALRRIIAEQFGVALANRPLGERLDDAITFARVSIGAGFGAYPAIARWSPRYRRAKARILGFLRDVVADHRVTPAGKSREPDLIDLLLAARDPAGAPLADRNVVANAQMVYSNALLYGAPTVACLLYALLKHPEALYAVTEEIDAVLGGDPITTASIPLLPRLAGATKESMRLYPIALTIPRVVAEPFEFEGYRVSAGTTVLIATSVCHFLPEMFPDPYAFDLSRYAEPRNEHRRPGAFVPFGLGAHPCPAAGLMEMVVMATVGTLLQHVVLELDPREYALRRVVTPFPEPEDRFAIRVVARRPRLPGRARAAGQLAGAVSEHALLSREQMMRVAARTETCAFAAGDVILREGDPADRFYILTEGEVEVFHEAADGAAVVLARRGPGEYFGEVGLLHQVPRTASVRAITAVTTLALDRAAFTDIVAELDLTSGEISQIVRQRMMSARLAAALPALTPATIARVTPEFELIHFEPGAIIMRQGDLADRFCILAKGEVEVVNHHPSGADIVIATLAAGDYFGEIGLLQHRPRTATVRAVSAVDVMALARDAFERLVGESGQTSQQLARAMADRLIELARGERSGP